MDEDTRAAFEEIRLDLDRRFARVDQRFEAVDQRFEAVDQRFEAVDRRFEAVDRRFDVLDAKIDTVRREAGVVAEDLRAQLKLVAEIVVGNTRAIERLATEMNARFREQEIVFQTAFRELRRDIEERRDPR